MENTAPIEIPLLIVIATIGIVIFIAFIFVFVIFFQKRALQNKVAAEEKERLHQEQLLKTTIEIAELERKKIAANLHDDLGAMINIIKRNISEIADNNSNPKLNDLSEQSSKLLDNTMDNIRGIAREIAPPVLMRMGFEEGLNELCNQLNNAKVLKVSFQKNVSNYTLTFQTQVQLYRIVQEIINNIIKHSGASSMQVTLKNTPASLITEIKHNGKGLTNEQVETLTATSKGIGLRSIKSRADVIRATINYVILGNSNSLTIIETPLDANEKTN